VDADLPLRSQGVLSAAQLTPDGELWVALAEKAYAQFRTGQNSYSSLNGGWMSPVYAEVTNARTVNYSVASGTNDALAALIRNQLAAGHALSAGSQTSAGNPIVASHAYVVKSIASLAGQWYVTVWNVWAKDGSATWDANPNDGFLTISMNSFRQNFAALAVCLA